MQKRKETKQQTIIYKVLHRKLILKKGGAELKWPGWVASSCSSSGTRRALLLQDMNEERTGLWL